MEDSRGISCNPVDAVIRVHGRDEKAEIDVCRHHLLAHRFHKAVPMSAAIRPCDAAFPRKNGSDPGIPCAIRWFHGDIIADHGIFRAIEELSGQYRAAFHTVHGDPAAISLYVDNARGYGIHFICRLHDLFLVVAAVSAWIAENGYEPDGSMFDIYHVSPPRNGQSGRICHGGLLPGEEKVSRERTNRAHTKRDPLPDATGDLFCCF